MTYKWDHVTYEGKKVNIVESFKLTLYSDTKNWNIAEKDDRFRKWASAGKIIERVRVW